MSVILTFQQRVWFYFIFSIQCFELSGNACEPSACFTLLLFTEHDLIDISCFYTWPMENAGRISSQLSEGFSFSHVSRRRGWFVSDVFSLLEARWFGLTEGAAWAKEDNDEHSPAVNSLDRFKKQNKNKNGVVHSLERSAWHSLGKRELAVFYFFKWLKLRVSFLYKYSDCWNGCCFWLS